MPRPKGSKNKPKIGVTNVVVAEHEPTWNTTELLQKAIDEGKLATDPAHRGPLYFQPSHWYKFIGEDGILFDEAGRILKWSVIKFEVVKVLKDIAAVRFEDGSFEAIVGRDIADFERVSAPRY